MIEYSFGERKCKLDWNDFICLTENTDKKYKSQFPNFATLYEYIDTMKKDISHILFDGYEYFVENGVLHNLYGPAIIRYLEKGDYVAAGTKSYSFYINGKLVYNDPVDIKRGCRKIDDFEKGKIFFYEDLTFKEYDYIDPNTGRRYRRQEGIDYIKTPIDLENRRFLDQRKKKLKQISNG